MEALAGGTEWRPATCNGPAATPHLPCCSPRNLSRLLTTRRHVRAHSCRVMWVAASQSRRHCARGSTVRSADLAASGFLAASALGSAGGRVAGAAADWDCTDAGERTSIGEGASSAGAADWVEAVLANASNRKPASRGRRMGDGALCNDAPGIQPETPPRPIGTTTETLGWLPLSDTGRAAGARACSGGGRFGPVAGPAQYTRALGWM